MIHVLESARNGGNRSRANLNTNGCALAADVLKLGFNDITGEWLDWPLSSDDQASLLHWLRAYWVKHIPLGGMLPFIYHALGRHFGGQRWYHAQS